MRAEQPAKLCKPRWRMRVKVRAVTGRPKAVLSLRFHLLSVRCCSFCNSFKCFVSILFT